MDQAKFKGKRAIVTGAGSGIGRSLVHSLVKLGTHVVAVSQTQEKLDSLKEDLGDQIDIVCVDIGNWEETRTKVRPFCNDVDYLVNNAGYGYCATVEETTEDEIDRIFNINFKGPLNLIQLVAPRMKERKFGSIVNVSSVAGLLAIREHVAYGASKAALDMVTRVGSLELGPANIRVNSVNPTVVWTKMGSEYWGEPSRKEQALSKIPMARFVEVREVIDPILFLLSNESSMINGVSLPIDGGYAAT